MTQSHLLSQLRFGLATIYAKQDRSSTTPGVHHLLPIPLRERLILLATIDGAGEQDIRRTLKVSREDASLQSRRMKRVLRRLKLLLKERHGHWPDVWMRTDLTPEADLTNGLIFDDSQGIAWNRRYGASLESALGQVLWSDVAVCLVGQSVPRQIAHLSLKQRLVLYCLLVDGRTQDETIEIMGCTEWDIDRSLRDGLRAVDHYAKT